MRGLMRVACLIVTLVALMGCSELEEQEVNHPGCFTWVDDREGGYCEETDAEANRRYRDSLDRDESSSEVGRPSSSSRSDRSSSSAHLDCDDFTSRAAAQEYLDSHPADAAYLDGDNDGVACEWGT